ncbi:hypothetical protein [Sessilibacter corallicola]|uniref:Uncharacterized protein n=1 Tax=Sessilibacter corallicola TaxID=2904075 RepID=A0ABQ0A9C0_9GAMM
MPDLTLQTLMISIQSVQKQIEYFEGLMESETIRDKAEIQELLLTYDQAAEELKQAYISKRSEGSNFPAYDELV